MTEVPEAAPYLQADRLACLVPRMLVGGTGLLAMVRGSESLTERGGQRQHESRFWGPGARSAVRRARCHLHMPQGGGEEP